MNKIKNINQDLLTKYNVQGPRYTSYPPAPSWKNEIGSQDYESMIKESNKAKPLKPLSIYIHLPFCEKLCYFCGCTTLITGKNRSFENPYLEALHKEIEWVSERLDKNREIIQFHFGGGTPTYQTPENLKKIVDHFSQKFKFGNGAELSIEVDPRVTKSDHLKMLASLGFNRISLGVQDFKPEVQEAINRVQSYDATKKVVDESRQLGFEGVNIDLIYGLPHQTPESFAETIQQILTLDPDRLAVYSYAHVPWLKKHQDIFQKFLPTQEQKFEIFMTALEQFQTAGYEYVGMDHFAKSTDELSLARKNRTLWRNFMGYTTKAGTDLFGFGMSSIGSVNNNFIQNQREVKPYQDAIQSGTAATVRGFKLSKDDQLRSRVIQNLLCHAVVKKGEIEREFNIQFDEYFKESLKGLESCSKDGLVELTLAEIIPTDLGRVFLRNLAMPFDVYLPKPGDKRVFSRTV